MNDPTDYLFLFVLIGFIVMFGLIVAGLLFN